MSVKQTKMYGTRSILAGRPTVSVGANLSCSSAVKQPITEAYILILAGRQELLLSTASVAWFIMCVVMIRGRRSYYKEQWMVIVAEEDIVNNGRTFLHSTHQLSVHNSARWEWTEHWEQLFLF